MIRKLCKACGKRRLVKFFYAHPKAKDGFGTYCKDCAKVKSHAVYEANKAKYKARSMEWYNNNIGVAREQKRRASARARKKNGKKINARHARYKKENPHVFSEHENRRRARLAGVAIEKIDRRTVYERDNGCCHICGDDVSFDKMELDHVIPIARGGSHTYDNLKVSHSKCNRQKWANVAT